MKTIVAGSRHYDNLAAIASILDRCPWKITEVVSGECRGVDKIGAEWATSNSIPVQPFPYKSELGRAGGPVRNQEMAEYADAAIVFWNGDTKGSGSHNMIQLALAHELHLLVVRI